MLRAKLGHVSVCVPCECICVHAHRARLVSACVWNVYTYAHALRVDMH